MTRDYLQAIALIIIAMTLITAGDTAGKLLGADHGASPFYVAWSRFLIGALAFLPFAGGFDGRIFLDWRIWLRALFIVCAITSILTALKTEPIANVFAIFFVGPIISYFASAILLGERVTLARSALLLLGFVGVLFVVKPGSDMGVGAGFALLAGIFYGSFLVASRWIAHVARPRLMLLSQLIIGSVLLTPLGFSEIPDMSQSIAVLTIISALGSAVGNLCLILAYRRSDASKLAPFHYVQLIAAAIFGVLIFGNWPDLFALFGILLLLTSGFATLLLRR
ncbi:DMT family transporter [Cochlodiniinecator piscidefendens]|uniref:DMT family transporter n=1 Tax=Cochlodiniinecator piscidefendens TaxID=2715756 RepID=UPI00140B7C74|nr:DMT family transporter [Cochlodiniinecator piscidefendens]